VCQVRIVPHHQIYSFAEGENKIYSIKIQVVLPELVIINDFMGLGDENHFPIHNVGM
jgi:hypothetical protein